MTGRPARPLAGLPSRQSKRASQVAQAVKVLIVMNLLSASSNKPGPLGFGLVGAAVSVQRLVVPDLVVINQQLNQRLAGDAKSQNASLMVNRPDQPEAARLINTDLSAAAPAGAGAGAGSGNGSDPQQQIAFECLISFDKKRDRNLIVKWHHDDRAEPIYQWIPELNKRSIAPQYRAYIAPMVEQQQQQANLNANQSNPGQLQLLEAGFKLIRPSKELGGKYTCSAISSQNDDSRWKKMIVYTPPRVFRFNASRTDVGLQLAGQRERLIHLSQPPSSFANYQQQQQQFSSNQLNNNNQQLPLAYRMRGLELASQPATISPQSYSTIDYVNVNQQQPRARQLPPNLSANNQNKLLSGRQEPARLNGVKLVCDIDQVFPVPEVSIYRLGKLDGSHPEKLAKLDTKIDINPLTGLYHVQVTSLLEDEELQMKYGLEEPVYFDCLIALTNLELSKYADNKRSIVYRPGSLTNAGNSLNGDQPASGAGRANKPERYLTRLHILMLAAFALRLWSQRQVFAF